MAVAMESNRDRERPHSHHIRTLSSNSNTNTTNEHQQQLFLCFTSRLSFSSSMKISKSILSPGRSAREISLSSSLSRRLKTNGSLKGGQSPMFPVTTAARKKTGAGYENPEPSSPKVTCIGQVRVKSKKKKTNHQHHHSSNNNIRSRSQRRSADYSFRRIDTSAGAEDGDHGLKRHSSTSTSYRNREIELESSQRHVHKNQKWVHVPVTICESLRSFGSDFNCFLPCRSSSCISEKDRQQQREAEKQLGCGSVLARWIVAVQDDGEGGVKGGRQIELVVGGGDDDEVCGRSYRKRHVMEDIDIKKIERNLKEKVESLSRRDGIVEGGRASICVPPKNALLLMRCGSDPVKMAALANRAWEPPEREKQVRVVEEEEIHEIDEQQSQMVVCVKEEDVGEAYWECDTEHSEATILIPDSDEQVVTCDLDVRDIEESISLEKEMKCKDENKFVIEELYHEEELCIAEMEQAVTGLEEVEHNDGMEVPIEHGISHEEAERDSGDNAAAEEEEEEMVNNAVEEFEEADQLVTSPSSEQEQEECGDIMLTEQEQGKQVDDYGGQEESDDNMNAPEKKEDTRPAEKEKESSALPDCLLLMMCEPKLSMEVSQETWVCTTDFIRWLPPREVNKTTSKNNKNDGGGGGGGDELSKRASIHYKPPTAPPRKSPENPQFIPPRSSCSYPAPPVKQDPAFESSLFNLTRCKSEPRRAAAGTPESCFWKNRPHAPVGVGAAGMGF